MALDLLRQLVSQYAANQIDHARFRHQFISQFLSVRHADGLESLANSVESACAEYSHDFISEAVLKGRIARIVLPTQVATLSNVSFTVGEMSKNANAVMSVSAANLADSIEVSASAASNPVEALELVVA